MDGSVVIGTRLDTSELEKQLNDEKKELERYKNESEKLTTTKAKLEIDSQKTLNDLEKIDNSLSILEQKIKDMESYNLPENLVGRTDYQELINKRQELNSKAELYLGKLEDIRAKQNEINGKTEENVKGQERLRQSIERTSQELGKSRGVDNITKSIDSAGKSLKGVITSTIRWGLAIFGVRSAYMFVRQAMSTLSQYDDQMATNIEYIRYLLASTLKPVIEYIIQLAYKLLAYINYIAGAWFHVNLFANASTEAFQNQNKALGGSVKKAKELKKTLTGFDEMNVLQDNGDVSSGGGGGGVKLPSFPAMEDVEIPKWVQWIVDHKDELIAGILGIAAALGALKLGLGGIMALGIGLLVAGVVYAVMSLLDYLKDPTWENFGKIIQGIGVALIGLGLIISGPAGLIVGIIGGVVLLYGTIIKYWEDIKAMWETAIKWLESKSESVHKFFGDKIGDWYDTFVKILGFMLEGWDNTFTTIKGIFDEFIKLVKNIINGDWKSAWKNAWNIITMYFDMIHKNITLTLKSIWEAVKTTAIHVGSSLWGVIKGTINGILYQVEEAINSPLKALNKALNVINKIPGVSISSVKMIKVPRLAKGGIINMPGKGIPVGGAIAGERGAEGVIPLTDSQQMALLGEAIGKYITINANITNTMNGRVISRELKKVQNDSDFAYNR